MLLMPVGVKEDPFLYPQKPELFEFSSPPQNPEQQVSLNRHRPPSGKQHDLGWRNSSLSGTFPFNSCGLQHVVAINSGPPGDGGETPSKHVS